MALVGALAASAALAIEAGGGGERLRMHSRPAAGNAPRVERVRPAPDPRPGATAGRRRSARRIRWRDSLAVGEPGSGALARGVLLPRAGERFFTWDPVRKRRPNRAWRRWGTDDLVRTTLGVVRGFARAHPGAPRVGIGDLSRPRGGDFGPQFGYIGHATHQNGLDVDVYYPRLDRRERPPDSAAEVDVRLAQDLVDRFLRAGAVIVYVGPSLPLSGPPGRVVPIPLHDNHLHARIAG